MLNNVLQHDCRVNVVTIGTHLWYKLNESYETVSYMCLRGSSRTDFIGSDRIGKNIYHCQCDRQYQQTYVDFEP